MPRSWENEFLWVIATKGKSFCSITKRIAWSATIYHLWGQRNSKFMRTSFLLLMIFFTSYVMMLDFVYLVFKRLLIIL